MAYKSGTVVFDSVTTLGPANYQAAGRPTVTFTHVRNLRSAQDVVIYAPGYNVDVVSVAQNVATYRVSWPAAHTHVFTGSVMATHNHVFTGAPLAGHQHDITTVAPAGLGAAMFDPAAPGPLEGVGPGGQTDTGAVDAASGGTPAGTNAAITAGTPAGTNAVQTVAADAEVTNGTNLAAVTFRCRGVGYANNAQEAW